MTPTLTIQEEITSLQYNKGTVNLLDMLKKILAELSVKALPTSTAQQQI